MTDLNTLAQLNKDDTIATLFKQLAKRTNDATVTTADQLTGLQKDDGSYPTRHEAREALKTLANKGFGHFRIGRRGKPTRLQWGVSAKEIAEKAVGAVTGATNTVPAANVTGTFTFRFPLRHDFEFRAELP